MTKFKLEAFMGIVMLTLALVGSHAIVASATDAPAAVTKSVSPMDMMSAARNLPDQVIDTPY